jgi:hypothetical protein
MTASVTVRAWIIESIRRILAGHEFTYEDFASQPNAGMAEIKPKSAFVSSKRDPAAAAWIALQQWVNDADIRAKDADYGEMKKEQLRDFLRRIEAAS